MFCWKFESNFNAYEIMLIFQCWSSKRTYVHHSPIEHYATITLTFSGREGETELNIECRSVPKSEEERTKEGWHRYYLQGIKQTFGYGTRLYWTEQLFSFFFCFGFWSRTEQKLNIRK